MHNDANAKVYVHTHMVCQISTKVYCKGEKTHLIERGVKMLQAAESANTFVKGDNINHPSHYTQGKVECLDAIESAVTGLTGMEAVYTGHIIRYVWRWKRKNGVEDLKKALFYIKRLINYAENLLHDADKEAFDG